MSIGLLSDGFVLCKLCFLSQKERKKKNPKPLKKLDKVCLKRPDNPQVIYTLNFYVHLQPKLGKSREKVTII